MDVLATGGPVMYVVAGLGVLGLLVALGLTGMGISRKRIPLAIWLLIPLLGLSVGAIGAWMGAGSALSGLDAVSSLDLPMTAKQGYAQALLPDWLGRWVGATLMAVAAWGAGLGAALRSDEDTRTTLFSCFMAVVCSIGFSSGCAAYTWMNQLGTSGYALAALLAFGGFGVAVGSFRRHLHDHAFRIAGMRFASGLSLIFAMSWASKALVLGNNIELANQLAQSSGSSYAAVLEAGVTVGADLYTLGWIAMFGAWAIAFFGFFAELGDVVQKGTLFDMGGVILLLLAALGVRLVEQNSTGTLKAVGDLGPLANVVGEYGYDLTGVAAYDQDGNIVDARPMGGGFGDVVLYEKENGWTLNHSWNGSGWTTLDPPTKLSEAKLNTEKSVLLVAKGDVPVDALFEPLAMIASGEALLLGRMDELSDSDSAEVKAREGILFPIKATEGPNFAEELWIDGDTGWLFEGPVMWFGEGWDAKKLYQRERSAFTMPEPVEGAAAPNPRKGLHIVAGQRTYVKKIFEQCAPVITAADENGKYVGNGLYCHISRVELAEDSEETAVSTTITKALETFVPATPENVRVAFKVPKELDAEIAKTRIDPQLGAFSYCGTTAGEGAEIKGRLQFKIYVGMNGKVDSIVTGEKSQVEAMPVIDCAKKRIRTLTFSKHEIDVSADMPFIDFTATYR